MSNSIHEISASDSSDLESATTRFSVVSSPHSMYEPTTEHESNSDWDDLSDCVVTESDDESQNACGDSDDDEPAALSREQSCGIRASLFSQVGCCVLKYCGVQRLRGSKYPYNPKLPAAETLLNDEEEAKVHFLAFHVLSAQLIRHGYINYTHKRVSVKQHLLPIENQSAANRAQLRTARECLQIIINNYPALLEMADDKQACNMCALLTEFFMLFSQDLIELYRWLQSNQQCEGCLPVRFKHLAIARAASPGSQFLAMRRHWVQLMTAVSRPAVKDCPYAGLGKPVSVSCLLAQNVRDCVTGERFDTVVEWYMNVWYTRAKRYACTLSCIDECAKTRMNACLPPGYCVDELEMKWQPGEDTFTLAASTKRNVSLSFLAACDASTQLLIANGCVVRDTAASCCMEFGKANSTPAVKEKGVKILKTAADKATKMCGAMGLCN